MAAAGRKADLASAKAAIPAGRLSTPTPTIPFTKLKTSLGIEAPSGLFTLVTAFLPNFLPKAPPLTPKMALWVDVRRTSFCGVVVREEDARVKAGFVAGTAAAADDSEARYNNATNLFIVFGANID